jgi:hypothetical protein
MTSIFVNIYTEYFVIDYWLRWISKECTGTAGLLGFFPLFVRVPIFKLGSEILVVVIVLGFRILLHYLHLYPFSILDLDFFGLV